tara:strand:+ start:167 stop:283 length:117 start_codon:yes stop_codon:yes gene_type:complete
MFSSSVLFEKTNDLAATFRKKKSHLRNKIKEAMKKDIK